MNLRRLALLGGVFGVLLAMAGGVTTGVALAQRANVPPQRELIEPERPAPRDLDVFELREDRRRVRTAGR